VRFGHPTLGAGGSLQNKKGQVRIYGRTRLTENSSLVLLIKKRLYDVARGDDMCKPLVSVSLLLLVVLSSAAFAAEWRSCASDLDDLRSSADDAQSAAERAERARREFEEKKEELENCLRMPDVYDLLRDRCRSKRFDFESARDDYQSKLRSLQAELSDVESRVGDVSSSCRYNVGSLGSPAPRSSQGRAKGSPRADTWCSPFQQYRNRLPRETLLQVCSKDRSPEECRKCIDSK
jgi:hypothetical protein